MSKQNLRFIVTSTFLPIVNNQLDLAFVDVKKYLVSKTKKARNEINCFHGKFGISGVGGKKEIHKFHQIFVKLNVA